MKMDHSMTEPKEIILMMTIMFIAGLLSSMNVWVDKISDARLHINDIYMSLLMCSWCLLFIGIYYINLNIFLFGLLFTGIMIYFIRNQIFIDEREYIDGMIPHHSMAVLMSKKLLEKNVNGEIKLSKNIKTLSNHIINSQDYEIEFMKNAMKMKYKNYVKQDV
jgi:hypothetical protein